MKLGIDVSSLAYEGIVDQIVLIAGDSDFVPAAKVARRKGIDFILGPMGNHVNSDLLETLPTAELVDLVSIKRCLLLQCKSCFHCSSTVARLPDE